MKEIKLKRQPRWVIRSMFILGGLMGLGLSFYKLPIGSVNATSTLTITESEEKTLPLNGNGGEMFTFRDMTVSDGTTTFTIMDRNLGATTNDITSENSYGYHYQRGNNYGFSSNSSFTILQGVVDASNYGPNNYYESGTWITAYNGYDSNWDRGNNNLRGGSGDSNRFRWMGTDSDRQGPCPNGYHIPSRAEYETICKLWCDNTNDCNYSCRYYPPSDLIEDLKIPLAGRRRRGGGVEDRGSKYFLWTSSPEDYYDAYIFTNDFAQMPARSKNNGASIRCIKNSTVQNQIFTLTIDTNGGKWQDSLNIGYKYYNNIGYDTINISGTLGWRNTYIPELGSPIKYGLTSPGWYKENGEQWDFGNDKITGDTVLHAGREVYMGWRDYVGDGYIELTNGEKTVYLKDRNQGAEISFGQVLEIENLRQEYEYCYGNPMWQSSQPISMETFSNECRSKNEIIAEASRILSQPVSSGDLLGINESFYDSLYESSYGDYYFRGNNNGATREELGVSDNYYANISQSAYNRGFNGGVMGEDSNNGWIEGNVQNNPCDGEGEYLPTYSDRKEAMDIWSTIYGYDFYSYDYDNYGYSYLQNNGNNDLSDFFNDLLIPNAGYIHQYWAFDKMAYDNKTFKNNKFIASLLNLLSSPVYAMDIGGYDMVFNSSPYLHMALDSGNNYGRIDNSQIYYYNLNYQSYDNTIAASVRCFLDPEYVEELKANTTFIIPTDDDFEISVGEETYTELPDTMTVTTGNISEINDEPVYGEVTVDFGIDESAKFSKLVQVKIPVEDASRVVVKVKHEGSNEYNFDGLTKNRNASCDANGRPTSSPYKGETITVVNGFATIYTCEASSFIAVGEGPLLAQIILSVDKGELTIGTETGTLDLGQVSVSNNAQEIIGEFGADSFWVEDMKGVESGYYTTISVTDLTGNVASHVISANNISLKTENGIPSLISGADVSEALVVFGDDIKSRHNTWSAPVTYFNREDTPSNLAGRVGKWGDNLQIKVNIPAHTPSDIYRGTITYTLYDLDSQN